MIKNEKGDKRERKQVLVQGVCDRCGDVKFNRNWHGVANMCVECIEIAEKEMNE